jgi:hypothetical protein
MELVKHEHQVYQEAVFVGITMLPLWMLVQQSTAFMRIEWRHKDKLDVLLAGVLYHLIAEDTGLNEFYAKNGAAVKKLLSNTTEGAYDGSVVGNIDWLCSDFPNRDCPKVLSW